MLLDVSRMDVREDDGCQGLGGEDPNHAIDKQDNKNTWGRHYNEYCCHMVGHIPEKIKRAVQTLESHS